MKKKNSFKPCQEWNLEAKPKLGFLLARHSTPENGKPEKPEASPRFPFSHTTKISSCRVNPPVESEKNYSPAPIDPFFSFS